MTSARMNWAFTAILDTRRRILTGWHRPGSYFETGYSTPICHPTRFELMTGQYGHHNGVYHFPGRVGGPPKADQGADVIASHLTIGQVFQQAGYATAQCGKWQLSGKHPDLIVETGFDEYCMWAYTHNLPPGIKKHDGLHEDKQGNKTARYWHPSIVRNGEKLATTINDYGPDIFSDFAIDFAKKNKEKPFFIYYPMALVHAPYWPTPDDHPADNEKDKNAREHWQSNVEYTDKIVGKLISALERDGRARQHSVHLRRRQRHRRKRQSANHRDGVPGSLHRQRSQPGEANRCLSRAG